MFGRFRLLAGGQPLAFRAPARARSLLVYLLSHIDQALARDEVAFTLWPDVSESEARTRLRDHLYSLRTGCLPPSGEVPWVLADKRTIRWNAAAPFWLDVAEFRRLAADPARAAEAVDLYAGDLASELDEQWLESSREQLREEQTALLLRLTDGSRERGDLTRALEYAQRLGRHDACREDALCRLMTIQHELGDRTGALHAFQRFRERLRVELGVMPLPQTVALFERIAGADQPRRQAVQPQPPQHNLRSSLTTFVGRERDVESLGKLLEERRIVTLTGAGGVGKTRLAIETARTLIDRFQDGIWLVELAPLANPTLIASTIATVIGLENVTVASLIAALHAKRILLILDNCEHLIDAAAAIAEQLLEECSGLSILATSREPLRIAGERLQQVRELRAAPAVQLFLDRAVDVSPAFQIRENNESDRLALATITRRLDGIPLAIELAAARARSLSLTELAHHLENRFALLTTGNRTALPRQQTLRATLDWSYDLLTESETLLLQCVGIFAGGWTLDAATAVADRGPMELAVVVDLLASLVDKSLVLVEQRGDDLRYALLDTTRSYALDHLTQAGARVDVARRHADYFLSVAERNDTRWGSLDSGQARQNLNPELDNFRAALSWAIEDGNAPTVGAALVGSLQWFFSGGSLQLEFLRWCEASLTALGPNPQPAHEASVQLALASTFGMNASHQRLYYNSNDVDRALAAARRAVDLLRTLRDHEKLSYALSMLALRLRMADRPDEAVEAADEALEIGRKVGKRVEVVALYAKALSSWRNSTADRAALLNEAFETCRPLRTYFTKGAILQALGEVSFETGDFVGALAYAQESLTMFSVMGLTHNRALSQCDIAAYALCLGEIDAAEVAAVDAIVIARRIGEPKIGAVALTYLAGVAAARGELRVAARLLGTANVGMESSERLLSERSCHERTLAMLRGGLSSEELLALDSEGCSWTIERAAELAMSLEVGRRTEPTNQRDGT